MLLHLIAILEKIKYHNEENYISYKKGIEIDHVLASGTFPGFFDYPKFQIENESREIEPRTSHFLGWWL